MNGFDFSIQRHEYHALCSVCRWERADTSYERWWADVQGHDCPGEGQPVVTVGDTARSPLEAP